MSIVFLNENHVKLKNQLDIHLVLTICLPWNITFLDIHLYAVYWYMLCRGKIWKCHTSATICYQPWSWMDGRIHQTLQVSLDSCVHKRLWGHFTCVVVIVILGSKYFAQWHVWFYNWMYGISVSSGKFFLEVSIL